MLASDSVSPPLSPFFVPSDPGEPLGMMIGMLVATGTGLAGWTLLALLVQRRTQAARRRMCDTPLPTTSLPPCSLAPPYSHSDRTDGSVDAGSGPDGAATTAGAAPHLTDSDRPGARAGSAAGRPEQLSCFREHHPAHRRSRPPTTLTFRYHTTQYCHNPIRWIAFLHVGITPMSRIGCGYEGFR